MTSLLPSCSLFFFHDPPTTEIYTLSLHDALPIFEFIVRLNALLGAFAISAKHTPKGQTIAAHPFPGETASQTVALSAHVAPIFIISDRGPWPPRLRRIKDSQMTRTFVKHGENKTLCGWM